MALVPTTLLARRPSAATNRHTFDGRGAVCHHEARPLSGRAEPKNRLSRSEMRYTDSCALWGWLLSLSERHFN